MKYFELYTLILMSLICIYIMYIVYMCILYCIYKLYVDINLDTDLELHIYSHILHIHWPIENGKV